MTWGEFKGRMEQLGVQDHYEIEYIDIMPTNEKKVLDVEVHKTNPYDAHLRVLESFGRDLLTVT